MGFLSSKCSENNDFLFKKIRLSNDYLGEKISIRERDRSETLDFEIASKSQKRINSQFRDLDDPIHQGIHGFRAYIIMKALLAAKNLKQSDKL
jgi:hypothetical protein